MRSLRLILLVALVALAGCKKRQEEEGAEKKGASDDAGAKKGDEDEKVRRDLYGDPLPEGALARLGSLRFLDRSLQYLVFTPKGDRVISNRDDGYVVWDVKTAKRAFTLPHDEAYWPIAVAPDGRTMATGLLGGRIQLWDLQERSATATLEEHRQELSGLCFLGADILASASEDGKIILWDLTEGKVKETLEGDWPEVTALGCGDDEKLVAWGAADGGIFWHKLGTKGWQTALGRAEKEVTALAIAPETARVAAGSADQKIRIWEVAGAKKGKAGDPLEIQAHDETVHSLAFDRGSGLLYSSGGDAWFRIWNAETGALVKDLTGVEQLEAQYMALSPDGTRMASWSEYSTARGTEGGRWWLWNAKSGKMLLEPERHKDDVSDVAFAPDGESIATASFDSTVRLWKPDGKPLKTLSSHQGAVRKVAFSPDGKTVWSAGADAKLHIWNPASGELRRPLAPIGGEVTSFAPSPSGSIVATGDLTGRVWTFDLESGNKIAAHDQRTFSAITDVAFNRSGSQLIITGAERTILVSDPSTGDEMVLLEPDVVSNFAVAVSPDGERMASAGDDHKIRLWQTDPWKEIGVLKGHDGSVRCVAFSPDGARLASGGNDETVILWDVKKRKRLRTFSGHQGAVTGVSFSPDGKLVASSSGDQTALVWNAAP